MNRLLPLLLLFSFNKIAFGQNNEDCVKKHLNFLGCKSHYLCSNNESETYHKELIANYFYIVKNYEKSILPDDYNQIGKEYFQLKNYDSAMYFYQLANGGNDTNAVYLNNIGTILFMQGLYDSSFIYFNLAFEIDSLEQDYINNLASYFGTKGNYSKCIELSLKSLKINKKYNANLQALNSLVITYNFLKNKSKYRKYKNDYEKLKKGKGIDSVEIDCDCTKYLPNCEI